MYYQYNIRHMAEYKQDTPPLKYDLDVKTVIPALLIENGWNG